MNTGDFYYYFCGLVFAFFGYSYLEERKKNSERLGSKIFVIPLAGLFLYDNGNELWMSGDRVLQVIVLFTVFCIVSPLIGFLWYGKNGFFRKLLFSTLGFAAVSYVQETLVGQGLQHLAFFFHGGRFRAASRAPV